MLFALLLASAPQVVLGPVSGVSDDDVQAALQAVRTEVERAGGPTHLVLEVLGGVTRVLLVLERIEGQDVDARAECSAPSGAMDQAHDCIAAAIDRFVARTRPIDVMPPPAPPTEAKTERSQIALISLLGVSGALAIAGSVLAWYAVDVHGQLEELSFADERFDQLERDERRFGIVAGIVLGSAAITLAGALIWAALE